MLTDKQRKILKASIDKIRYEALFIQKIAEETSNETMRYAYETIEDELAILEIDVNRKEQDENLEEAKRTLISSMPVLIAASVVPFDYVVQNAE